MQDNKFLSREKTQGLIESMKVKKADGDAFLKGLVAKGYTIEGYNDQKKIETAPQQSFLDKTKADLLNRASALKTDLTAPMTANDAQVIGNQRQLRVAGDIAGGVNDVIGNAVGSIFKSANDVTGGKLGNIASSASLSVLDTPLGKQGLDAIKMGVDAWNNFKVANPDVAKNLESAGNIAGLLPISKGATLAKDLTVDATKAVATGVKDVAMGAKNKVVDSIPAISKTPQEAIDNTYKGLMNLVENKQSLLRDFVKSEGRGKDPIKMIAENPDYMVKVNPEAKTIDAANSLANMQRDIANYSEIRDAVLKTADESLPALSTKNIFNDVKNVFSDKNYKTYLDAGVKGVNQIVNKLKTMQQLYGDNISRYDLQQIRKGIDETINSFTDTKMQDRMRLDLRTVFKNTLENSVPENGLLKELNNQIGDLLDASKFVGSKLNGTKVKGGGLTDLAMKTAGAATGAGLGGVAFGIPGAIGGYAISNFLSKTLIKNAINNPFDRAILEKLKQVKPEIIKQAEDYINSTKSIKLDTKGGAKDTPTPSPEVPPQDLSYNANIPQLPKNGSGGAKAVVDKKLGNKPELAAMAGGIPGVAEPQYDEYGNMTGVKVNWAGLLVGSGIIGGIALARRYGGTMEKLKEIEVTSAKIAKAESAQEKANLQALLKRQRAQIAESTKNIDVKGFNRIVNTFLDGTNEGKLYRGFIAESLNLSKKASPAQIRKAIAEWKRLNINKYEGR